MTKMDRTHLAETWAALEESIAMLRWAIARNPQGRGFYETVGIKLRREQARVTFLALR